MKLAKAICACAIVLMLVAQAEELDDLRPKYRELRELKVWDCITAGCAGTKWEVVELVTRDGLYYKKFTDVPFTGNIKSKLIKGKITNGTREGPWIKYHETGQLMWKGSYKDGKREGAWVIYSSDGWLRSKGTFKDGKREGAWVKYDDDGGLSFEGTYKDGKRHGHGTDVIRILGTGGWMKYVGEFKDDRWHGRGITNDWKGYRFVGEFKDGKKWQGTKDDKFGKVVATYSEGVEMPVK